MYSCCGACVDGYSSDSWPVFAVVTRRVLLLRYRTMRFLLGTIPDFAAIASDAGARRRVVWTTCRMGSLRSSIANTPGCRSTTRTRSARKHRISRRICSGRGISVWWFEPKRRRISRCRRNTQRFPCFPSNPAPHTSGPIRICPTSSPPIARRAS